MLAKSRKDERPKMALAQEGKVSILEGGRKELGEGVDGSMKRRRHGKVFLLSQPSRAAQDTALSDKQSGRSMEGRTEGEPWAQGKVPRTHSTD